MNFIVSTNFFMPNQGIYVRIFFVLNRDRVSNPWPLTYTQTLVKYPPCYTVGFKQFRFSLETTLLEMNFGV